MLGQDECGAGNMDAYCQQGHWEGLGQDPEYYEEDAWGDCKDFKEKAESEL